MASSETTIILHKTAPAMSGSYIECISVYDQDALSIRLKYIQYTTESRGFCTRSLSSSYKRTVEWYKIRTNPTISKLSPSYTGMESIEAQ